MHHPSRTNLSLDELVKKTPSREKGHHLNRRIARKESIKTKYLN